MAIETSDMTVFLAVVKDGSFGRAAARLMVSQPAVSERIARLERTLGAELFTRSTRGVTLTTSGERLVSYAERTIQLLTEAAEVVSRDDGPPPVRIAVHVTFAHRAVPMVLEALTQQHHIRIRDAHSDEIITMLLDGVVDVGFVLAGTRPAGLGFVQLPEDPVVAVCAPRHPVTSQQRPPLRALVGHRIALNRWGAGAERFLGELTAAGVSDNWLTECSDAATAVFLATRHDHIALVTRSMVRDELSAGRLTELALQPPTRWTVPLVLAYRKSDDSLPVITALKGLTKGGPAQP